MKNLTFSQRKKIGRRKKAIALSLSMVVVGSTIGGLTVGASAADVGVKASDELVTLCEVTTARSQIPVGAREIDVIINGRHVLDGRVFYINGSTYVPMFAFADWLGYFD